MLKNNLDYPIEANSLTLKIVVVGHVDDGKSTLIGRLLYETGALSEKKVAELKTLSSKRHMPMEWSFVLDAFQAERDQAITIDITQIPLRIAGFNIHLIDAPGHIEFLKNMVSGAADANAAFLLIDASEGIRPQTRRHCYFLNFLGIKQVAVIVNKMDLIQFSDKRFQELTLEIFNLLNEVQLKPLAIIPISARHGYTLISYAIEMPWYQGPTVLDMIKQFALSERSFAEPLRFPVQDVYKFDDRRIIAGRIESGSLKIGDLLLFSPSNQQAMITSIVSWNSVAKLEAKAGESIGITINQHLFVQRGDVISHIDNPPLLTRVFRATLFWLGDQPLEQSKTYKIKLTTRESYATVKSIDYQIDTNSFQKSEALCLEKNQCGEVILTICDLLPVDEYQSLHRTGRFVLIDEYEIVSGGMISMRGFTNLRTEMKAATLNLTAITHDVSREKREKRNLHTGGVLWFTGLSGAGKSTLAMQVEQLLFLKGYQVYVLDGDNIRCGLNADLGFSPPDRAENLRRVAQLAALFTDAGFICIVSFISPYQIDRDKARALMPAGSFHEVFIKADLETCERRDPKGLYQKARVGKILDFTGVSAHYEIPLCPDLIIDTGVLNIQQCIDKAFHYVKQNFSHQHEQASPCIS